MKVILKKSSNKNKKYMLEWIEDGKKNIVHFGAAGYDDFILSGGNEEKKRAYLARHSINEDWTDWRKPGTLSRYILWNKSNLNDSIKDFANKFRLDIKKM